MELVSRYLGGASIHQLAREYNVARGTIRHRLRKYGVVLPLPLGKEIEKLVAKKLRSLGHNVELQNNISPYDLLVDGMRVDVKSARKTFHKSQLRYIFQLQDITERKTKKVFSDCIDYFYFVFLDEPLVPIYSIGTNENLPQSSFAIKSFNDTKYNLEFVANLKSC